jgi:hypothetical protein
LLVTHNTKGEIEGVKYERLSVLLINAVKEQEAQIAQQVNFLQQQRDELRRERTVLQQATDRLRADEAELQSLKKLVCLGRPRAKICKARR